jgi:hypothetical protein
MTSVPDITNDPRWRRLNDAGFMLKTFGVTQPGLFTFDLEKPLAWEGGPPQDPNAADIDPRNYLLQDFCVIDNRQFFIRTVLELPILGTSGQSSSKNTSMAFSLWVSVSALHFDRYGDTFNLANQSELGTFPGKIANRLGSFPETIDLACTVFPQNGDKRPLLAIDDGDHALGQAQRHGVTLDHLLDFYAACGFDIRAALSA